MTYNDVTLLAKQASYFAKKLADDRGDLFPDQKKHYEEQLRSHLQLALNYTTRLSRG